MIAGRRLASFFSLGEKNRPLVQKSGVPTRNATNPRGSRARGFVRRANGAPNGSRTRVVALKGRCPRPLDDGDARTSIPEHRETHAARGAACAAPRIWRVRPPVRPRVVTARARPEQATRPRAHWARGLVMFWWGRWDSNPQSSRREILSLLRMPIPPRPRGLRLFHPSAARASWGPSQRAIPRPAALRRRPAPGQRADRTR